MRKFVAEIAAMQLRKGNDVSDWQEAMDALNRIIRDARKIQKGK